jgi:hypothetical protein
MRIMEEDAQMTEPKTAQGAKSEQYFALRSFFQDSCIQVPDGEMPSRVMKPQTLKQNISSPPKDTRDKDRETMWLNLKIVGRNEKPICRKKIVIRIRTQMW